MKLALIIVNYNNKILTLDCIKSFQNIFNDLTTYVVDNSSEQSQRLIEKDILNIKKINILYPSENIGYFSAIIYCINNLKEVDYDYYLVGNNDVLCNSDWAKEMQSKKSLIDKYPVICPRIVNQDGDDQNPMIPKAYTLAHVLRLMIYNLNYGFSIFLLKMAVYFRLYKKSYNLQRLNNTEGEIAIGFGAFYILTKEFFKLQIEIPNQTFLMGEEQFFYINMKKMGKSFYYLPTLKLIHREHSSVNKIPKKYLWSLNRKAFWKYIWKMPIRLK
jgi:GT2 family glycosyltransferase